jgi:glutamine synthetase type III
MGRISFFGMLADDNMSFYERAAINSASDRADAAMEVASAQSDAFGQAIASMQRTIMLQQNQLKTMGAMIGVLAAALRDNGTVDPDVLDARLEAAIENAQEEIKHEASTVLCIKCNQMVPKAVSNVTELGVECDRCMALG